jgi:hypothetical protein
MKKEEENVGDEIINEPISSSKFCVGIVIYIL